MSGGYILSDLEEIWIEDRVDSICHDHNILNDQAELDEATEGDSPRAVAMREYMNDHIQMWHFVWADAEAQE
jgi:hypothetical protein